jgi:hypothetical protein
VIVSGLAGVPIEDLFDVARSLYEASGDMTRAGLAFLATAGQDALVSTIAKLCEEITAEYPDSGAEVVESALAELPAAAIHAVEGMMGGECKSCGKKYKGKVCKSCAKMDEGAGCAPKAKKGPGIGVKAKPAKPAPGVGVKAKKSKPKFGKTGMWEGSNTDVDEMALAAALAESKKQVNVGSYTRTSKSGKISRVGSYSQWRLLPGRSMTGVGRGSVVKFNVGDHSYRGTVHGTTADGAHVHYQSGAGMVRKHVNAADIKEVHAKKTDPGRSEIAGLPPVPAKSKLPGPKPPSGGRTDPRLKRVAHRPIRDPAVRGHMGQSDAEWGRANRPQRVESDVTKAKRLIRDGKKLRDREMQKQGEKLLVKALSTGKRPAPPTRTKAKNRVAPNTETGEMRMARLRSPFTRTTRTPTAA